MNRGQPSVFCYPDIKELLEGPRIVPEQQLKALTGWVRVPLLDPKLDLNAGCSPFAGNEPPLGFSLPWGVVKKWNLGWVLSRADIFF